MCSLSLRQVLRTSWSGAQAQGSDNQRSSDSRKGFGVLRACGRGTGQSPVV